MPPTYVFTFTCTYYFTKGKHNPLVNVNNAIRDIQFCISAVHFYVIMASPVLFHYSRLFYIQPFTLRDLYFSTCDIFIKTHDSKGSEK